MTQPDSPGVRERRLSRRFPPKPTTRATCHRGTLRIRRDLVRAVHDLSETGACLLLGEEVARGEPVELGLQAAAWSQEVRVPGIVMWAVAGPDGACRAGVLFSRCLSLTALGELCLLECELPR